MANSEIPLHEGLRAVAQDAASASVESSLNRLADHLAAGGELGSGLKPVQHRFAETAQRLIDSAMSRDAIGNTLVRLIDFDERRLTTRRNTERAFAYPIITFLLGFVVLVFVSHTLGTNLRSLLEDSSGEMIFDAPPVTYTLIWWGEEGVIVVASIVAVIVVGSIIVRLLIGSAATAQILGTMPIFGSLVQWHWVAEGTHLLSLLLNQDIPLPEATRLTSGGVRSSLGRKAFRNVADQLEKGMPLALAVKRTGLFPHTLVPLIRASEPSGTLTVTLREYSESLEELIDQRSRFAITYLPTMIYILTAGMAIFMLDGFARPLLGMITALAGVTGIG